MFFLSFSTVINREKKLYKISLGWRIMKKKQENDDYYQSVRKVLLSEKKTDLAPFCSILFAFNSPLTPYI